MVKKNVVNMTILCVYLKLLLEVAQSRWSTIRHREAPTDLVLFKLLFFFGPKINLVLIKIVLNVQCCQDMHVVKKGLSY